VGRTHSAESQIPGHTLVKSWDGGPQGQFRTDLGFRVEELDGSFQREALG
jgi:hypothetical protein